MLIECSSFSVRSVDDASNVGLGEDPITVGLAGGIGLTEVAMAVWISDETLRLGPEAGDTLAVGLSEESLTVELTDDTLTVGLTDDVTVMEAADDIMTVGLSEDTEGAGLGDDTTMVGFGDDTMDAGPVEGITGVWLGDDTTCTGLGDDTMGAGLGEDTTGDDTLVEGLSYDSPSPCGRNPKKLDYNTSTKKESRA